MVINRFLYSDKFTNQLLRLIKENPQIKEIANKKMAEKPNYTLYDFICENVNELKKYLPELGQMIN